ncbi:tRNA-splicing endonuclease subunit Sen2 isoform X2 [Hyperolius riggenbachi]|uniref:tRNA-splicing endonuclease subunit Sen2 isoform X2 n=1 Tax=Hyperolius riggenbachi TaxID=752182 RepID=UPI0035A304ED
MSQAVFHAPRRKRRVYESYESPFPIPMSHDSCVKEFRVCQAEMVHHSVIVRNLEEIELLYGKGFFGKGILSRSRPEYNIDQAELRSRWKGSKAAKMNLAIISSNKYQRHVEWARSLLEEQGMDASSIDKMLGDYTGPVAVPEDEDEASESVACEAEEDLHRGEAANPTEEGVGTLEGNPAYDPLAKYPEEQQMQDTGPAADTVPLENMRCHRHDDLILHCGCKPDRQTVQSDSTGRAVLGGGEEYVLVEEEEDGSSSEEEDQDKNEEKRQKLVCRRNPFRLFEYLQLSREEAFFLVYALGCLTVSYRKEPLTILKLWETFCSAQKNFQTSYMAYHHFRSKGWVPKAGLKYGTDLLLYRKGPPFYHASYSVIVELVDCNYEGTPLRPLTWRSLSGLNRTTMNVSKELLICYLIKPPNFTEEQFSSPECIKKFKVQEVLVSRWVSSRERMEHEDL